MRAFGGDALGFAGLLQGALGADADEFVEPAGCDGDAAAVEEGDRLHRAVQQDAIVRDQQCGAGKARKPGLQPQRGFQVEVVGRLVEQQQVGCGEQRGGQCDAHAPAAGELLHRALLRGLVEAQAGEDGGNSIFRYDDEMLVNQHIYRTYGYIAPILHLRRLDGADLFDTYMKSFEMVWEQSYPYQPGK